MIINKGLKGSGAWAVLHISLFLSCTDRLNKTEFVIFIPLLYALLPRDLKGIHVVIESFGTYLIFTAAGVVPCGGRKRLPTHHHSVDYSLLSLEIIEFILVI